MKALTREMILNCEDIKTVTVLVPEWGGEVTIKMMSGKERDEFEASITKNGTMTIANIRAKLAAKTIIDPETKKLMFTEGDIEALGAKSASALDKIATASARLSKMSAEDLEELTKN